MWEDGGTKGGRCKDETCKEREKDGRREKGGLRNEEQIKEGGKSVRKGRQRGGRRCCNEGNFSWSCFSFLLV